MPRVTPSEHFRRHRFVRMLFLERGMQIFFGLLHLKDQYELHEYYATENDFAEAAFEAYRRVLDARFPSLSNRAGKHFKVLEEAFITASRAHGITSEQISRAIEMHNQRHANPAPRTVRSNRAQPVTTLKT